MSSVPLYPRGRARVQYCVLTEPRAPGVGRPHLLELTGSTQPGQGHVHIHTHPSTCASIRRAMVSVRDVDILVPGVRAGHAPAVSHLDVRGSVLRIRLSRGAVCLSCKCFLATSGRRGFKLQLPW